jgi:HEAT repeat protein
VALAFASQARSAELPLPKDGWASWEVQAVEDAPAWCCWSSWDNDVSDTKTCQLDGGRQGYGTRRNAKTDAVRVYARLAAGKVERVRALAASCPVETKTPIRKLDNITTDDSARWLAGLSKNAHEDVDQDTLAALAMHRGNVAFDALSTMARTDSDREVRKRAIFWLAEMRGSPGADIVAAMMFNDKDSDVRKHSAFAITQSKSADMAANLIRQGQTDVDADVRAQAWFWLAQSGAPNAEEALLAATKKDQNDHVREQAIFALSQLPDERATPALIKAAEDRSLSREQRKRALFWLAQSESPGAQKYLDKVLAGNTAR